MVFRFLFFLLSVSLLAESAFSQGDSIVSENNDGKRNIGFGFNYHLQISNLDVAPIVFYRLHKRLDVGLGLNYLYYYRKGERENTSAYGSNIFTRAYFVKDFFLHLEYLYSNVAYRNDLNFEFKRVYIANFFTGLGYRQPVTSKVDSYLSCLVDLTHRNESPYKNLIVVKFGMSF